MEDFTAEEIMIPIMLRSTAMKRRGAAMLLVMFGDVFIYLVWER